MRALLVFLSSCTDLASVDRNACGNMVVESGELCDTFAEQGECGAPDGDHPCAFVCSGSACPPGWSCGGDGRCRLPDRRFASAPDLYSFRSIDVTIGDVDGDAAPDLIGNDRSRFSALFQTSPRLFEQDFLVETRLPLGSSFFTDLDGDARIDAIVPTLLGLVVLLGQEDRTLLSRVYDTALGAGVDARFVVTAERTRPVVSGDVAIVLGDFITAIDAPGGLATQLPSWLDPAALPPRIPSIFGTFALWNAGRTQIALYRMEGTTQADRLPVLQGVLETGDPLEELVEFADVDGDGSTDIAAAVSRTDERVAIARTSSTAIDPFCNLRFELFSEETGRWAALDAPLRKVADFDGDAIADYVFDIGVLTSAGVPPRCGVPVRTARFSAVSLIERWREVETGDFNGDGRLDFAAASDERQLDVYFGSGTGGFARRTVLLDQPPTRLRAGDFDGDFIDDVAMVFDGATDLLTVVFGDAGSELSDPRAIGRFAEVTDAIVAQWAFDAESLDLVSDLLIQSRAFDSDALAVAIAYGSTSRQMFAPFVFPNSTTGPPLAVVAGDFCRCMEPGCPDRTDVAALSRSLVPPRFELWGARGVPGEPPGRLDADPEPIEIPLAEASQFELACSIWQVADVDSDPRDEIFALDNTGFCGVPRGASRLLVIDPNAGACDRVPAIDVRPIEQDAYTGARRIRSRDLDADGDVDLLLVFAGREGNGAGLAILWNDGGRFDRTTAIDVPADQEPVDADAIQLDADPALEIVLRTQRDGEGALWFVEDGSMEMFRRVLAPPAAIAVGDLDRDGLDDIAIAGGGRVSLIWAEDAAP